MGVDPVELASLATALIEALREAQAMAASGHAGAEFEELLQHARELIDIMHEHFAAAGQTAGEYAGGLLHEMRERLATLAAVMRRARVDN
ncbi:MAG: hypothetical protein ABI900_06965 [Betaproteobacteria bacterium]